MLRTICAFLLLMHWMLRIDFHIVRLLQQRIEAKVETLRSRCRAFKRWTNVDFDEA